MNRSTIRVLALFGLIATLSSRGVTAQSLISARFKIPFNFTVGSKSFAAGDYRVLPVMPHILRIENDHNRATFIVIPDNGDRAKMPANTMISFHRYGERYFLVGISNDTSGWHLPRSVFEKDLIAGRRSSQRLDLTASLGK